MLLPLKSLQPILLNEKSCINYLIEKGVLDINQYVIHVRKLKVNEILQIGYYWLAKTPHISIKNITGHSPNTITYYTNRFRALIRKRKHNYGHHVKDVWVFGGVEWTTERKIFAKVVSNRTAKTLLTAIEENISSGSIIYLDMCLYYIDPNTGVYTNTIERTWNEIKLQVHPRNHTESEIP
ncbi:20560_t:CDS:2, partial [Dentiscutata erythropus]